MGVLRSFTAFTTVELDSELLMKPDGPRPNKLSLCEMMPLSIRTVGIIGSSFEEDTVFFCGVPHQMLLPALQIVTLRPDLDSPSLTINYPFPQIEKLSSLVSIPELQIPGPREITLTHFSTLLLA